MRFPKQRKFEMVRRVAWYLKQNKKVLCERVPALDELADDLVITVASMDEMYRSQEFRKTNVPTAKKRLAKAKLLEAVNRLVLALTAYAYKIKETDMQKKVEFTEGQLRRVVPEETARHCEEVIATAKTIGELSKYGIKPEDIAAAEQCLREFIDVMRSPQKRRKDRADERKLLEEFLQECIFELKKQIDGLVYLATEKDFLLRNQYKEARKVFPAGQGRKSEKEKRYLASRKRKPRL